MKLGKLLSKKDFAGKFLAFTFFFAIAIYALLIGFIYWMSRKDENQEEY